VLAEQSTHLLVAEALLFNMAYYAEILNDLVVTINVVNDDVPNGAQFCTDLFGGMWVQTFDNLPNKNFAVIGDTYDAVKNNFIAPQPYPSWTLDSNDIWQPPVPQPPAPPYTYWDEDTQTWQPYAQP
jgi:hypothetical protein